MPDFLASDYCFDVEMKRALERHDRGETRVIPVIVRACDWTSSPFARLQALPKDAKPVTSWASRDQAWADVARGIRVAAEGMQLGTIRPEPTRPSSCASRVPAPRHTGNRAPCNPAINVE